MLCQNTYASEKRRLEPKNSRIGAQVCSQANQRLHVKDLRCRILSISPTTVFRLFDKVQVDWAWTPSAQQPRNLLGPQAEGS
jgi:hypothetical protein